VSLRRPVSTGSCNNSYLTHRQIRATHCIRQLPAALYSNLDTECVQQVPIVRRPLMTHGYVCCH